MRAGAIPSVDNFALILLKTDDISCGGLVGANANAGQHAVLQHEIPDNDRFGYGLLIVAVGDKLAVWWLRVGIYPIKTCLISPALAVPRWEKE